MERLDLDQMIDQLKDKTDEKEIVDLLQNIEIAILNDYEIEFNGLTITPLLIEAYYHQKTTFPDYSVHAVNSNGKYADYARTKQKKNYKKIYIHPFQFKKPELADEKYSGVDVCLSDSDDFYFSILIKNALIDGEFFTQEGIAKKICFGCDLCNGDVGMCAVKDANDEVLKLRADKGNSKVVFLPRKGIAGAYMCAPLAAIPVERITDYNYTLPNGYGLQWRAAVKAISEGHQDIKVASTHAKKNSWCSSKIEEKFWSLANKSLIKDPSK